MRQSNESKIYPESFRMRPNSDSEQEPQPLNAVGSKIMVELRKKSPTKDDKFDIQKYLIKNSPSPKKKNNSP